MSFLYDFHHGEADQSLTKNLLKSLWSTACQPYFVAMVVGVIISITGWQLPDTIDTTLSLFGATVAPVALFAVGIDLDFSVFKKHLLPILGATIFKLILMPILAWFMCHWLGLDPIATVAVVLCSSVAAAKCQYGVAKQKHIYVEPTAAIVASTTILSIITLAIVIIQLNEVYPEVFQMEKTFHHFHHGHSSTGS